MKKILLSTLEYVPNKNIEIIGIIILNNPTGAFLKPEDIIFFETEAYKITSSVDSSFHNNFEEHKKQFEKDVDAIIGLKSVQISPYEFEQRGTAVRFVDDEEVKNKKQINVKLTKEQFMKPSVVKNFIYNAENYDARLVKYDKENNFEIKITGKIKK